MPEYVNGDTVLVQKRLLSNGSLLASSVAKVKIESNPPCVCLTTSTDTRGHTVSVYLFPLVDNVFVDKNSAFIPTSRVIREENHEAEETIIKIDY